MHYNRAKVSVTAVAFDENCNVRDCVNCSEEFIKYAVEKCREMKGR
jgi:hypothetical protein